MRRDTAANILGKHGAQGELWVDTTNNRVIVNDGVTPNGFPAAKLSEVPVAPSANGATASLQWVEQLITCSGTTTNIPLAGTYIIFAVALRVVTAITGCASITVNDSQNGNGHWGSGIGVSTGTTNMGVASPGAYYDGVTTLALAAIGGGASFSGGTVRVSVLAMAITPPAS
jgi:hypothetical protein